MQAFVGVLAERHKTADGSAEYVHIIFGGQQVDDARSDLKAANIVDAEFLFLTGTTSNVWSVTGCPATAGCACEHMCCPPLSAPGDASAAGRRPSGFASTGLV